jgi:WD40 repeat protein
MQQCNAPLASFGVAGKGDPLCHVQISPDGQYLAWCNGFGAVTVAEPDTGKPIWSQKAPAGRTEMVGLAISPDGRLLAREGKDGTIELRRLADGKLLRTVSMQEQDDPRRNKAGTTALAFSPDSKKLAVAWESWIGLIDVERGAYLHSYPGTFGRVVDLGCGGRPPKRTILCSSSAPRNWSRTKSWRGWQPRWRLRCPLRASGRSWRGPRSRNRSSGPAEHHPRHCLRP